MAVDVTLGAALVWPECWNGPPRSPFNSRAAPLGFEKYWHFCRTDFRYDEWLCRVCDRFSPNADPPGRPVLYRKRKAIQHEKTLEHRHCVERFNEFSKDYPELVEKSRQCEMGWGPGDSDPLFPDQVYDHLTWNIPDVRKGADFLNQFVTFWVHDVAAALEELESAPEELSELPASKGRSQGRSKGEQALEETVQKRHTRPTFEEFFEGIETELDTWGSLNSGAYGGDGWGNAAMPAVLDEEKPAEEKREKVAKDIPVPEGDGWVVQKGRGRGRGSGRGRGGGGGGGRGGRGGRGHGPQRGRGGRQRQTKTDNKVETQAPKNVQETTRQNLFSQLRVDDAEML